LVINRHRQQIATISDPVLLDGPWDLTILDGGDWAKVFVSNVLNDTVTRLDPEVDPNQVFLKTENPDSVRLAAVDDSRNDITVFRLSTQ
jgi:hypothetical protein